jgi:hypothetical protein
MLRGRWVTLRGRWVMLRGRWVTLRARWVTLRARWVTLRARWVTLRGRWVMLRGSAGCRAAVLRHGRVRLGARGLRAGLARGRGEKVPHQEDAPVPGAYATGVKSPGARVN